MKNKVLIPILVAVFAAVALIVGIAIGENMADRAAYPVTDNTYNNPPIYGGTQNSFGKINAILTLLDQAYVDTIDVQNLTDAILPEIMHNLDPHSAYVPAAEVEESHEDLDGSFSGIGVQFNIQNDTIMVVDVIAGGPSERLGIRPGDRIIDVDGKAFTGDSITNNKVLKTLRGKKGTFVNVKIKRAGVAEPIPFTIKRDDIPVNSIDIYYMIAPQVGYLKISRFGANTYTEFMTGLTDLSKQGAKEFIIDLRYNGGGYLSAVIQMVNEFLDEGDLIVYTEGLHSPRQNVYADGYGRFKGYKVCVLINEFSASASEIFSGAIQDLDKGVIIGRRSFGKGLVQQQIPLTDGSEIRLTTSRYYTPSGRCIQKPYKQGEIDKYEADIVERYDRGEFFASDSITLADSLEFHTRLGRTVYGGGGIMPDYFVAQDTTVYNKFYKDLSLSSHLYGFSFQYADQHRANLSKIKDWQSMQKHIQKSDYISEFKKYLASKKVEYSDADFEAARAPIENILQAYIARNILGDSGFYPIYNQTDETIKKALEYCK
ncbi:MAG: S41 family peptidase [Paludibacteraceae bacterium]|nr:S41 family peptidase [Paludibacteraceae bacterium]